MAQTNRLQSTLTIREAAALLGVHPNTVRNRINRGIYKAEKVITSHGATYFIQRDSLTNSPTNNSSTKDLQKLPNKILEASPQDLQALLSSVVKEAIETATTEAEEKDELTRVRVGATESIKLEHNSIQHLGTLSLAAIAAFGAILGVFSPPEFWDEAFYGIPTSRPVIIVLVFGGFLISALVSRLVQTKLRIGLRSVERANNTTHIEDIERSLSSMRHAKEGILLVLSFGTGVLSFILFISQSTPS